MELEIVGKAHTHANLLPDPNTLEIGTIGRCECDQLFCVVEAWWLGKYDTFRPRKFLENKARYAALKDEWLKDRPPAPHAWQAYDDMVDYLPGRETVKSEP